MSRRAAILAALLAATIAGIAWLLRDPMPHFVERRSALATVEEGPEETDGAYRLRVVRVTATSGLAVDLTVRRAIEDGDRQLPVVLILGGHYTGQRAVRMLGDSRGALVAAMSYPFTGDPRPDAATFLREIPKIRAAFLDTPPAISVALDYLLRRHDADAARVEGVGVSLGAPFVCIAGALDRRFTRVWALHGSGGSFGPLELNMRRTIRFAPLRIPAAAIANVIIDGPRLAPERWVDRIAPRPFVMVNATGDERLPRDAVMKLYEAAGYPKELVWMEGRHVHADSATIRRLTEIVLTRVRSRSDSSVTPAAVSSGAARW